MALYLLDTNIVTEPLKRLPNETVIARLQRHQHELVIAAPVWHELWFGCSRLPQSKRRIEIETYLSTIVTATMPILPYDDKAAHWYAIERARLANIGQPTPFTDGQIAAVAAVNHLILVTNNTTDYAHFNGLAVENWFKPVNGSINNHEINGHD